MMCRKFFKTPPCLQSPLQLPTYTCKEMAGGDRHAYAHCPNDKEDDMVSFIFLNAPWTLFTVATSLANLRGLICKDSGTEVCATLSITADWNILHQIYEGYSQDKWVSNNIKKAKHSMPRIQQRDGLWYMDNRLIIPHTGNLHETLFRLAHDVLGHFSFNKTYTSLCESYYWPNMQCNLKLAYVPGCMECQCNKSMTSKLTGLLHPLPVPDGWGDSVTIDFIGPLPKDKGHDMLITFIDQLGANICLILCSSSITAEVMAQAFFNHWYCKNGLPLEIISDCDKFFISWFWKALHKLTGTKIKMSTVYHPEIDGVNEHTNKMVNQMLHFHVKWNQSGWVKALPLVCFNIMNTVNKSTGFSPFHLQMGHSVHVIPPLVTMNFKDTDPEDAHACKIMYSRSWNYHYGGTG